MSTSEQSQSRCRHPPTFSLSRQVFSCLLSHHRPGPSRRHPSLGHNTSSCFSSSHSFSLPVCYPQRAQSKHLKTENGLQLCPTETPVTPRTGLTVNTPRDCTCQLRPCSLSGPSTYHSCVILTLQLLWLLLLLLTHKILRHLTDFAHLISSVCK